MSGPIAHSLSLPWLEQALLEPGARIFGLVNTLRPDMAICGMRWGSPGF